MEWIAQNWQTVAALVVVALTLAVFAYRLTRPRAKSGCGSDCACEGKIAGKKETRSPISK